MMPNKLVKKLPINITKEQIAMFLPFAILILVTVLFFTFIFLPLTRKLHYLKTQIKNKEPVLLYIERSGSDLDKLNREIKELQLKIDEHEKKLLKEEQANILIETLKEITAESYIKFSSLEPQPPKKFSLTKQKDAYLELPIKIKLKCSYFDLIDFLAKIEKAGRVMKITELEIKGSLTNIWEHDVLLSISTFARITAKAPDSG